MYKLFLIFIFSLELSGYELPKVNLEKSTKPEIVYFYAKNILIEKSFSYIIKWKTINATDVKLSLIGKVEPVGKIIITEEEYKKGVIVLKAINKYSQCIDTEIIIPNTETYSEPEGIPEKTNANYSNGFIQALVETILITLDQAY
ncbi:hypothetical protein MNB_SM-4-1536 [hydrothermal vent metagenome]|uniref:Uncharacterized protein n=1 Tax=hydrothermal vent metagenome TaxID=652676 RepID=A0A1W1BE66_9ZZZZ